MTIYPLIMMHMNIEKLHEWTAMTSPVKAIVITTVMKGKMMAIVMAIIITTALTNMTSSVMMMAIIITTALTNMTSSVMMKPQRWKFKTTMMTRSQEW